MIFWFTGQPGAGKSTLAIALRSALQKRGHPVVHLDGEFLRELMATRISPSRPDQEHQAAQQLAVKLNSEGIEVVASLVFALSRNS
jgi:adenylylsulfate kinase-like enzyme